MDLGSILSHPSVKTVLTHRERHDIYARLSELEHAVEHLYSLEERLHRRINDGTLQQTSTEDSPKETDDLGSQQRRGSRQRRR